MATPGEFILEVSRIHKRYSHNIPTRRRQLIRQFARAIIGKPDERELLAPGEFWALQGVSFSLARGEALGLIGLNGAGKSTLLQIIARQLLPDIGLVSVRGKIAALINLTAGFEETLTGRENVFLKGALLGRSRTMIRQKFDEIVSFAEIEEFIDSPVGTYSSGMRMRLAFSVAIHSEPDLLLIDEVLSVGDFRFRQKCLRKLNELREHASFIFVSHSFQDIARFCDRLIVLNRGSLVFDGPTTEGIQFYVDSTSDGGAASSASQNSQAPMLAGAPLTLMGEFIHQENLIESVSFSWVSDKGKHANVVKQGEAIIAELEFRLKVDDGGVIVGLPFWSPDGTMVTSVNTDTSGHKICADNGGAVSLRVRFEAFDLNPGTYYPVVSIGKNTEVIYRQPVVPIKVTASYPMTWGVFTPRVNWSQPGHVASTSTLHKSRDGGG